MKGGLGQLMKQAQKLQEDLQQAQNELASMEVVGESGAGMVAVTMTGRHDVRSVRIDPALMGEDKEMLEDLIAAAMNDAVHKVDARDAGSVFRARVRSQSSARPEAAVLAPRPMALSPVISRLIEALRCLPGVGPKSAQRMAFHLLQRNRKRPASWRG